MTTETFHDALRSLHQLRLLIGRRDLLREALSREDSAHLAHLEWLWQWRSEEPAHPGNPLRARRYARCDLRLEAVLRAGGKGHPVTVVSLGGGGAVVTGAPPLGRGAPVTLEVRVAALGREFRFPAQARWREDKRGADARLVLSFGGLPLELRFGPGRSRLVAEAA